jgi:ABC-2 type transport system permease protein
LLPTVFGIGGIGFIMGGLAIVFKKTQTVLNVLQIVLLALVFVPIDRYPFMKFLPMSFGNSLLLDTMVRGVSIFRMDGGDLLFLVANTVFYMALGLFAFKAFERAARARGLLGHY